LIGGGNNPQIWFDENRRQTDVLQIIGSIAATYKFTDWISLRTQFSMDYRQEDETSYRSPIADPGNNGSLTQITAPTSNFQTSTTLNFNRQLTEDHNISGLLGFEYRRDYTRQFAASGIGFPNVL